MPGWRAVCRASARPGLIFTVIRGETEAKRARRFVAADLPLTLVVNTEYRGGFPSWVALAMRASDQGFFRQLGSVAGYMAGLALLFIGFVALLGFPWRWVLPTVVVLEVLAILLVLRVEYSARRVDGASGWMTFGFLFGHAWLFGGAALLRLAVWLWQHFVH